MKLLEERIVKDGKILAGDVLKLDSFLNHQVDVALLEKMGKEFHRIYAKSGINKILTLETNGISIACFAARAFECPMVFAKKFKITGTSEKYWRSVVHSYTRNIDYDVVVSRELLSKGDRVLIIDDVLANGSALEALIDICNQAGATVVGAGIAVEKAYRDGGKLLRNRGIRVESLARIASMSPEKGIKFC